MPGQAKKNQVCLIGSRFAERKGKKRKNLVEKRNKGEKSMEPSQRS